MKYTALRRDDFDKSFKYKNQSFLCYSKKKLSEVTKTTGYEIVGFARKTDKDTEHKLLMGNKQMSVYDPDKSSLAYKTIGYIPVEEDSKYIAIQEGRAPFLIGFASMVAVTAVVCTVIINTPVPKPEPDKSSDPIFNPLPPVDSNLEDYADAHPLSENKEVPKGGGKVTISYKPQAEVLLESGEVKMEYQNPAGSSHDAVLELFVVSGGEEYTVATSGRIPAGKQLKTMQLTADNNLFAGEGKYEAEYKVYYYDPVTGERALTEANINDITLIVKNQ